MEGIINGLEEAKLCFPTLDVQAMLNAKLGSLGIEHVTLDAVDIPSPAGSLVNNPAA